MPSWQSRAIAAAMTVARLRNRQFDPARFASPAAPDPAKYAPPSGVRRRVTVEESRFLNWPVYTVVPPRPVDGHILYLHGGAHAAEIQPAHWSFVATLAVQTGRTVTVPIYPLVPAATHRDVQPVLRSLYQTLADRTEAGAAGALAVMGDSAGAGLALTLVAQLPAGVARPRDLVLLSPYLDVTLSNPQIPAFAPRDPLLRADHLRELGRRYAGGDDPAQPAVSPINGPLDRLGTVTVFTGTRDLLHPDALRFRDLAAAAPGTTVLLHQAQDMVHDWMLLPIPEARQVVSRLAAVLTPPTTDQTLHSTGTLPS
ncbi:alpha/beta hydrolase [Dactylosporangium vinaceum]|uniref:Alpha/beta hydrolase fold domain-containing protein n=1 Tax=Dactylosporangium vinaceum TaxID=53362 RepID=A0ABV5M300_9ACTN|nr:alpha/beta hydrolase [Dactylosporangium vinaceum]UAB99847.1 alpha/beta hydrolase [Dactylosporangium vinaceum]